ncbi:MAG TPA: AraC family transcriptional regulator ligand-binding domain-containing protein, partial [Burkholderiaceae bacterium]|nr:AraC family transcriptional regulator ligand-binding domain-containing protein [Burkholderiaceae bacterium]
MASEFTVPVGTLALVQEAARQLGTDPDRVLRAAGVEPSALRLPMSPIATSTVARALVRGRELSGCEHFAILAGAQARLGNAGLVPLLLM